MLRMEAPRVKGLTMDLHPIAPESAGAFSAHPPPEPERCSGRRPACRRAAASRPAYLLMTNRTIQGYSWRPDISTRFPGGGTPALYGRQDARRYSFAESRSGSGVQCAIICRGNLSPINTPRRASLRYNHLRQQRQLRLQLLPDPHRHIFARRIFQPRNLIEVAMIQFLPDRLEHIRNIRVIHHPPEFWIAFARHRNLHLETMPVQPSALVRFRQSRQQMRRLKLKCLSQFHI